MQPGTPQPDPVGHDPGAAPDRAPPPRSNTLYSNPLHHSGRQRYADPRDLPSYPSLGLKDHGAAASAAASLGWAGREPARQHRKADSLSSASAAVLMARDLHNKPDQVRGASSSADHKAATAAAGSAQRRAQSPKPLPSAWGSSAASLAFESARASSSSSPPSPKPNPERAATRSTATVRQGPAHAARTSPLSARQRSKSSPHVADHTYPDQANAAANALAAATIAHRPASHGSSTARDSGSTTLYAGMDRRMFTSHPPVEARVDEQRHADSLHTSAVTMAKSMYAQQQRLIDTAKHTDESELQRSSSFSRQQKQPQQQSVGPGSSHGTASDDQPLPPVHHFSSLQEAAYRLAQERLAKLHHEHQRDREYREYYGPPPVAPQHGGGGGRFDNIRGKLTRRRSSSDGELIEGRKGSLLQGRRRMSVAGASGGGGGGGGGKTTLSRVDEQKRTRDRDAVFAVAQRNVRAQLEGMDQRVLLHDGGGRAAPRRLTEWELQAHSAAQVRSAARRDSNFGKVDIGGGKYMDRVEVDDIAARAVKPLMDDIDRRAEAERERQAAEKLDEQRRREAAEKEKQREKEMREAHHQQKEQQKEEKKARKSEAKHESQARKEEDKAAKEEAKHRQQQTQTEGEPSPRQPKTLLSLGSRKKTPEQAYRRGPPTTPLATTITPTTANQGPRQGRVPERMRSLGRQRESSPPLEEEEESPSPTAKVRNWLKLRFSRGRAVSSGSHDLRTDDEGQSDKWRRSFIGGIRLHRRQTDTGEETASPATAPPEPEQPAAAQPGPTAAAAGVRASDDSSSDASSGNTEFTEALDRFDSRPALPPLTGIDDSAGRGEKGSTPRESRFSEIID